MYLDYYGKRLPEGVLVKRTSRAGGIGWSIFWSKLPVMVMTYDKINEVLDKLDGKGLPYKETKAGCYTLATLHTLGIGYFIRKTKGDTNRIEVCGASLDSEDNIRLFRVGVSQSYDSDFGALDAWIAFRMKVKETLDKSLTDIFGGLPLSYLKYRDCVPSPINWASARYTARRGSIAESCVKADICSAYGTEASKSLPDCHFTNCQVLAGKHSPTQDFPFAFYLESGNMAIYGEGDTYALNQSPYITCDHTVFVEDEYEKTLLMPAATVSLADVFEDLYEGRKDNEHNKEVMNITIGMFHRKKTTTQEDNLWPLAAVIKFRCNKRIIDTCEWLKERGQRPILINTDSILWEGEWQDDFFAVFTKEKKLGNFAIEYKKCKAVIRSSKIYQVLDVESGDIITRWSGSHTKKYTRELAFGQIWHNKVYEYLKELESRNTIQWNHSIRRYVNQLGEIYENIDMEELLQWLKQD